MSRFRCHVFICRNERDPDDPRGCCRSRGADEVIDRLKAEIHRRKLRREVRINKSGCLDQCSEGVSIVVYPEEVWYGHVRPEDVDEIIQSHIVEGRPVERLRTDRS